MKTKLYLLTLLLLININHSIAQAPGWLWAKSATSGAAYNFSICSDASRNCYTTGHFYTPLVVFDNDSLTGDPAYKRDFFITKYDSLGHVLWAKTTTGANDIYGNGVAADANGNSFATGYFMGSGVLNFDTITLNNGGQPAMFIVKYDSNGKVLWAKNAIAPIGSNSGNAISTDAFGNAYVTGIYDSSIVLGNTTLTGTNMFVAKYDAEGNVVWAKGTVSNHGVTPKSISTDAHGNSYITGNFSYSASFDSAHVIGSPNGTATIFVVKYDSSGNVVWAKANTTAAYVSSGYSNGIGADTSGNCYITGYFYNDSISFGNFTLKNANNNYSDLFIVKYDKTGNVTWARRAGTPLSDEGHAIGTDANGNSYVTGFFSQYPITFGSTTLYNAGFTEVFVAKYDSSGNALWAKSIGGTYNDDVWGICTNTNGNCFVTGFTGSTTLAFDSISMANTGNNFVAMIDGKNSINGIASLEEIFSVAVYPNPTTGIITIVMDKDIKRGELNVFNAMGQKVYSSPFDGSKTRTDLDIGSGIYLLQITDGIQTHTRKIIKQ